MQVVRPEDVEVILEELSFISNEASLTCCAAFRDAHCATQQTARQFLACLATAICAARTKHKSEKGASQASWLRAVRFIGACLQFLTKQLSDAKALKATAKRARFTLQTLVLLQKFRRDWSWAGHRSPATQQQCCRTDTA